MIDLTPRLAETYVRRSQYGASLPQIFMVEDVGQCVIKFLQNAQGPRVPVNEIVGLSLASELGIDHPRVGLVEVDEAALPNDGVLIITDEEGDSWTYKPGLHFYSKWLEPADRVEPDDFKGMTLQNAPMLAGVVLLDLLIDNWDRTRGNMNLLLHRESGRQHLKLIDLSVAFGSAVWELGNLRAVDLPPPSERLPYSGELDDVLATIKVEKDFEPFLRRLNELSEARLRAIVSSVPGEWQVTDAEREALLNYLSQRVRALPDYLAKRLQKDTRWL